MKTADMQMLWVDGPKPGGTVTAAVRDAGTDTFHFFRRTPGEGWQIVAYTEDVREAERWWEHPVSTPIIAGDVARELDRLVAALLGATR